LFLVPAEPNGKLQLGLDVKTRHAEELTEHVEITEEGDEEQAIQEEVWMLSCKPQAT
jgi:AdoMet-dependent rRNA methyltransferase SPB1